MFYTAELTRKVQNNFEHSFNSGSVITDQTHNFSVSEMFKRALAGSPVPDNNTDPVYDEPGVREYENMRSNFLNQIGVTLEELGNEIAAGNTSIAEANKRITQAESALSAAETQKAVASATSKSSSSKASSSVEEEAK